MIDKVKFMEMLKDITEIGIASDNKLTKEEITEYFKGMDLKGEQFDHIYQYLSQNGISIKDYVKPLGDFAEEEVMEERKNNEKENHAFLKKYRESIGNVPFLDKEQEQELYEKLQKGDQEASKKLMECNLELVIEIASSYIKSGVLIEDLIQEGNIGLMNGIQGLNGKKVEDPKKRIKEAIQMEIEAFIEEECGESNLESTILAKTNLINEATKILAEELGRLANIHELAEYTKMEEQEIKNIINIAANTIEVGKCTE